MSHTGTSRTARERVVVGVDAQSSSTVSLSTAAVDWVVRRAHSRRLQVTLVTAFDSLIDDPILSRERLIDLAARITSVHPRVRVEIELANASIHHTLEELSRRADLVVIGSHRDRPIRSLLSGSLPGRVAAHAHCPTVVVPHDWVPRDGAVVVGLGDDSTSEPALIFAATEAQREGRTLEIVHAWRVPAISSFAVAALVSADDRASIRAVHREALAAAVSRLSDAFPGVSIAERLAELSAGRALVSRAADAELIVIGTHHHTPEAGLVLGSTASSLLHDSTVPLCVVPVAERSRVAIETFDPVEAIASVGF